ncbi:orotidine-5'-phosphate decarboxylase [Helicobacter didelphidarum]|uniref:Orotidine 5'-phosphate decarboxylase n=1 Tax=Helicobacter didelphidarum TaxID=2040648 RepID=A0A3D8IGC0_9HELI|nr:orotidine-5'-phosphate decarboxylase [Helicobacter didelphidarum]RDU64045.1 orotidine-5'-phosphate decarboxylase [Helicobacter didelphidarum]
MKLCVALDMQTKDLNLELAKTIQYYFPNRDIWLKVGLRSFIRDGNQFVKALKSLGFPIFLDLKLYDIPNTMLDSVKECQNLGVDMLTIHASCGSEAMSILTQYVNQNNLSLKIIAVSALTSFDNEGFWQVYNTDITRGVINFANLVYQSGIHGLVCSIQEVAVIKNISQSLLIVTPGIRLEDTVIKKSCGQEPCAMELLGKDISSSSYNANLKDDQKRISSPKVAKELGSDFIVVGRPIYMANDTKKVIESILQQIY